MSLTYTYLGAVPFAISAVVEVVRLLIIIGLPNQGLQQLLQNGMPTPCGTEASAHDAGTYATYNHKGKSLSL